MMSVQRLTLLLNFIASCTASHPSMGNSFPLGEGPGDYEDVRFAYDQVNMYSNVRYNLVHDGADERSQGAGAAQHVTEKMPPRAGAVRVWPSSGGPANQIPALTIFPGKSAPSLREGSEVRSQGSGYPDTGSQSTDTNPDQNLEKNRAYFDTLVPLKDNITSERSDFWYVCFGHSISICQNQSCDNGQITNSTNSSDSYDDSIKSNTQNSSEVQSIFENSNSTGSAEPRSLSDYIGKYCCPTFSWNATKLAANGSYQVSYTSFCNCDEKCALFGDCCPDMMHSCPTMLDSCPDVLGGCLGLDSTDRILNFREQMKKDRYIDVRKLTLSKALEKYPDILEMVLDNILMEYGSCVQQAGVLMVDRCPDTTDGVAKLKCENPASPFIPPVTVNVPRSQSVNFRNVFCAQCHGLDTEAITMWSSQIFCSKDYPNTASDLRDLLDSEKCHVEFPRPANVTGVRFCWNASQKYVCLPSAGDKVCTPKDELMCSVYLEQIDQFRNKHCMACNMTSHPLRPEDCQQEVGDTVSPHPNYGYGGGAGAGVRGGILIILDIFGTFSTSPTGSAQYLCDDDEIYDALTAECHVLICSFGFEPYKGKCVKTEAAYYVSPRTQLFPNGWDTLKISTFGSVRWNVSCGDISRSVYTYFLKDLSLRNFSFSVNDVTHDDEADVTGFQVVEKERNENVTLPGEGGQENIVVYLGLSHNVTMATFLEAENITKALNLVVNGNGNFRYFITNMMSTQLCPGLKPAAGLREFALQEYKGRVYAVVNSSITNGIFYPLDNIGYHVELNVSSGDRVATIYPCDVVARFAANCSVVKYDLNTTKLVNGSRELVIRGVVYKEGAYLIVDGEVFVCAAAPGDPNDFPLAVLSYVMTAVSCMLLLAMLVVYCRHAELRTLPGKMTASLAATMMATFVFNLLALANVRDPLICPIVAALCHVVTLAQFGWMSAIAVSMALTFGSIQGISLNSPKTVFFRYNLAVWGTSVCLVLTAVVLDIIEPDPQSNNDLHGSNHTSVPSSELEITTFPRYGFPHCSWFSGAMWTRLAFVIIPFSLTYLNNIVCFTITLLGIHKASRNSAKVGKKRSDLTRCLIYFKLSTAMGFAWILSLVVSLDPQNQVLVYTFNCCIFLQGALLFLAFMCNRRVYALVTRKVHKTNSAQKSSSDSMTRASHLMSKR